MMDMLRPSLEEAFPVQDQAVAKGEGERRGGFGLFCCGLKRVEPDYIGKRGSTEGITKEKRIRYASEILQKELLPHVAIGEFCEVRKREVVLLLVGD